MEMTKLEVRFRSLLVNCEELSDDESNFPRIRKFIRSLERMVEELHESSVRNTEEIISDYVLRLNNLKATTNYSEMINSVGITKSKIKTGSDEALETRQIENSKLFSSLRKELINDGMLLNFILLFQDFDFTMFIR